MTHSPENLAIAAFTLYVDQNQLDDLAQRLTNTRWPDEAPGVGWAHGAPLGYLQELAAYWREKFDWRETEARINARPQFTTGIDGHQVHFFHLRSGSPEAKPLLLIHGWPGAAAEFLTLADRLLNPPAGVPAFDLVIPTIPGFGVSGPTSGWNTVRAAKAFAVLMDRLGHHNYFVHGYDTGAAIARELGLHDPEHVAGIHVTSLFGGEPLTHQTADPDSAVEQRAVAAAMRYEYDLGAYAMLQATRPQSLAYALTDSPVGQLSWIIERFRDWAAVEESPEEALDRDEMLATVSTYWFFGTAGSSARYYSEGIADWGSEPQPSSTPTAVCVMPRDISAPVRRLVEPYNNILQWNELPVGGHFAGWEQPDLVAADIAAAFGIR